MQLARKPRYLSGTFRVTTMVMVLGSRWRCLCSCLQTLLALMGGIPRRQVEP